METLERLTRRTDTMRAIRSIVRTMKTMSAVNAAPYEPAARTIEDWRAVVLNGLQALLACTGPLPQVSSTDARPVVVALGSDPGFCGA